MTQPLNATDLSYALFIRYCLYEIPPGHKQYRIYILTAPCWVVSNYCIARNGIQDQNVLSGLK